MKRPYQFAIRLSSVLSIAVASAVILTTPTPAGAYVDDCNTPCLRMRRVCLNLGYPSDHCAEIYEYCVKKNCLAYDDGLEEPDISPIIG